MLAAEQKTKGCFFLFLKKLAVVGVQTGPWRPTPLSKQLWSNRESLEAYAPKSIHGPCPRAHVAGSVTARVARVNQMPFFRHSSKRSAVSDSIAFQMTRRGLSSAHATSWISIQKLLLYLMPILCASWRMNLFNRLLNSSASVSGFLLCSVILLEARGR